MTSPACRRRIASSARCFGGPEIDGTAVGPDLEWPEEPVANSVPRLRRHPWCGLLYGRRLSQPVVCRQRPQPNRMRDSQFLGHASTSHSGSEWSAHAKPRRPARLSGCPPECRRPIAGEHGHETRVDPREQISVPRVRTHALWGGRLGRRRPKEPRCASATRSPPPSRATRQTEASGGRSPERTSGLARRRSALGLLSRGADADHVPGEVAALQSADQPGGRSTWRRPRPCRAEVGKAWWLLCHASPKANGANQPRLCD